jgi:hypothetical protein
MREVAAPVFDPDTADLGLDDRLEHDALPADRRPMPAMKFVDHRAVVRYPCFHCVAFPLIGGARPSSLYRTYVRYVKSS